MNRLTIVAVIASATVLAAAPLLGCQSSGGSRMDRSSSAAELAALHGETKAAYHNLLSQEPVAAALARDARAVLVFPKVLKAGFVFGGYRGKGAMIRSGSPFGEYATTGASVGLQAGAQTYGFALFFMTDADLDYLERSGGWEIGTGPSLTVVDEGIAGSITSSTMREGVYAFFFDQKGLMGGLGLQGSKITRLDR